MEERIIDDEYARGICLKKTKDGYVDVTEAGADDEKKTAEPEKNGKTAEALEESLEENLEAIEESEEAEEVTFEFPDLEEDDEDLVNLTPEEAIALRKQKAEEEAKRKADYAYYCKEGKELVENKSFKAAELNYEKAMALEQEDSTEAVVGYWRARTEDYTNPDVFVSNYLNTGYDNIEAELGDDILEKIKKDNKPAFERRLKELKEKEKPLQESVEEKQEYRRGVLKERLTRTKRNFIFSGVPTFILFILLLFFASRITSRPDSLYVIFTAVAGGLFVVLFIVFAVCTNRYVNAKRFNRANEDIGSTEDGRILLEIKEYIEIYEQLCK